MLILDEQLRGRGLDVALKRWYRGRVVSVPDLRPGTVIKDDAIPLLLHRQRQAAFLTINVQDFWRKVAIDERFCVICLALPDSRVREFPNILRDVLRLPVFRTKAQRMGMVLRVTRQNVSYYTYADAQVQSAQL